MKQEEPYELRGSRTVLWEGEGEIPSPDPITTNCMTTRELTLTILLIIISLNFHSQGRSPSPRDSIAVFKTKETIHFLKTKDTTGLRPLCVDTVGYSFVDYETGTRTTRSFPLSSFLRQNLDSLVADKKLLEAIKSAEPQLDNTIIMYKDGSENTAYLVTFYCKNPHRKAKIYKYKQVTFTYVSVSGPSKMKLFSITVVA
jgi:hypothetical protein